MRLNCFNAKKMQTLIGKMPTPWSRTLTSVLSKQIRDITELTIYFNITLYMINFLVFVPCKSFPVTLRIVFQPLSCTVYDFLLRSVQCPFVSEQAYCTRSMNTCKSAAFNIRCISNNRAPNTHVDSWTFELWSSRYCAIKLRKNKWVSWPHMNIMHIAIPSHWNSLLTSWRKKRSKVSALKFSSLFQTYLNCRNTYDD